MTYVNLTPHAIHLNDGRVFPPSGQIARVSAEHSPFEGDLCLVVFGRVQNLPEPQEGVYYIVSALVADAARRPDVVSPATGHPEVVRDEKGQIKSVPGFIRR